MIDEILIDLAVIYDKVLTSNQITLYTDALAGLSDDAVKYAAARWVRESKWFPRPSELRAMTDGYNSNTTYVGIWECWQRAHRGDFDRRQMLVHVRAMEEAGMNETARNWREKIEYLESR